MIRKIMLAYDGGYEANQALDMAINIAQGISAEIYLVTIFNPFSIFESFETPDVDAVNTAMDKERKKLHEIISQAIKKAEDQGVKVQSKVIEDKPGLARIGPNLVNFAEMMDIDLIIMGRRNTGAVNRLLVGSVSNYVIQAARCAVMLVKE
ncbi:MAG: universal stress protein [Syntrophomonadaceae bacterium]|jgi:nucleotide-binding universal stress UspA family protein|nr:universal stress protein [Syntrophomonadaceae bacterium]